MSSLCTGTISIKGKKENVDKFYVFFGNSKIFFKRFSISDDRSSHDSTDGDVIDEVSFSCKNSIHHCMLSTIHTYITVDEKIGYKSENYDGTFDRVIGDLNWGTIQDVLDGKHDDDLEYVGKHWTPHNSMYMDLTVACRLCNVQVEIYSENEEECFTEYCLVDKKGEILLNEIVDY